MPERHFTFEDGEERLGWGPVQRSDLLRRHRQRIGSRWRKLTPRRQALLVPAHLRCGDTYGRLAAGFGVGATTVWRYVTELVELLAAAAPDLAAAGGCLRAAT